MEQAFQVIRSSWRTIIEKALEAKKEFQTDADECMSFFNGPYDFLYNKDNVSRDFKFSGLKNLSRPVIGMTVNKVAEGVQLFGPTLYHRNPNRKVNPRLLPEIPMTMFGDPNDPQSQAMMQGVMQQMNKGQEIDMVRAALLQGYLNYSPVATNLKNDMRDAIDETLIKGMGVAWTIPYRPAGSKHRLIRTQYDTVDNLLVDPDHESIEDAKWCAKRCCEPVWKVEAERGLAPGTLKGNAESHSSIAGTESAANEYKRKNGTTNDLLVYWKIWSKMGMGSLITGIDANIAGPADKFGRYVYLEIAETYNYLLNIPQTIWQIPDEMYRRAQWETPFWADTDGWPFSYLAFHKVPRRVWPMSHFRPGMGELKFINWAYSFLASRMQKSSRTFIAIMKAAAEEFKTKVLEGTDLTLLEFEQSMGANIRDIVQFLDHPEVKGDFIKVIEMVERNFEKRTGLNELLYGETTHQYRSAAESDAKERSMNIRPDDMNNKVEDWATEIARKEALAARWHLNSDDITPVFGPIVGNFWQQYVASADISAIVHSLEYRIEAGSTRKPNKDKDASDAHQAMQTLFPMLSSYSQSTGNVDPVNMLITFWGKANEMDVTKFLLPQPPPPQPPAPEPPKINVTVKGEELASLGLAPAVQSAFGVQPTPVTTDPATQEMIHNEADHEQEKRHTDEKHKLAMKHAKEKQKQALKAKKKP